MDFFRKKIVIIFESQIRSVVNEYFIKNGNNIIENNASRRYSLFLYSIFKLYLQRNRIQSSHRTWKKMLTDFANFCFSEICQKKSLDSYIYFYISFTQKLFWNLFSKIANENNFVSNFCLVMAYNFCPWKRPCSIAAFFANKFWWSLNKTFRAMAELNCHQILFQNTFCQSNAVRVWTCLSFEWFAQGR